MASNVMHRTDGRLRGNRDAVESAKLMAPLALIPNPDEVPVFKRGDVVLYDRTVETKRTRGQGTIEVAEYYNGYWWYRIRVDGERLAFLAHELTLVPVQISALSVHRLAWMRPPGYMGFDAIADWIPPGMRRQPFVQANPLPMVA